LPKLRFVTCYGKTAEKTSIAAGVARFERSESRGQRAGFDRGIPGFAALNPGYDALHIHLQRRDERFLRNVDLAELAHALFAFALLVEELALMPAA
jgi:hypothetical protein